MHWIKIDHVAELCIYADCLLFWRQLKCLRNNDRVTYVIENKKNQYLGDWKIAKFEELAPIFQCLAVGHIMALASRNHMVKIKFHFINKVKYINHLL